MVGGPPVICVEVRWHVKPTLHYGGRMCKIRCWSTLPNTASDWTLSTDQYVHANHWRRAKAIAMYGARRLPPISRVGLLVAPTNSQFHGRQFHRNTALGGIPLYHGPTLSMSTAALLFPESGDYYWLSICLGGLALNVCRNLATSLSGSKNDYRADRWPGDPPRLYVR